jgi:hypothetical protein
MRGLDERADSLFSYVDLQDRVSAKLPLRVIGRIVNDVLAERTRQNLRRQRPSLDSAGAPAASAAAAGGSTTWRPRASRSPGAQARRCLESPLAS